MPASAGYVAHRGSCASRQTDNNNSPKVRYALRGVAPAGSPVARYTRAELIISFALARCHIARARPSLRSADARRGHTPCPVGRIGQGACQGAQRASGHPPQTPLRCPSHALVTREAQLGAAGRPPRNCCVGRSAPPPCVRTSATAAAAAASAHSSASSAPRAIVAGPHQTPMARSSRCLGGKGARARAPLAARRTALHDELFSQIRQIRRGVLVLYCRLTY